MSKEEIKSFIKNSENAETGESEENAETGENQE